MQFSCSSISSSSSIAVVSLLGVMWHSLPAVEEEAGADGPPAAAELADSEEEEIPTWVGLETVFASLCWLTTEGWRRRAPGTAVWPVWNV